MLRDPAFDALRALRGAYQSIFRTPGGMMVLDDLRPFCRAQASCFHSDPRVHAVLEGRREVWLRIHEHIEIPIEEQYARLKEIQLAKTGGST